MNAPRRIAIVHSFYSNRTPSGENVVVRSHVEALRSAGHTVALVAQHTSEREASRLYPVEAALTAASGFGPSPLRSLTAFEPDVVHVHNLFPNFGTRWLRQWHGPLVATIHNFRPLCSNGYLFRDGHVCTECVSRTSFQAVRHRCFHDSAVATAPVAWRTRRGVPGDVLMQRADATVVLSARAASVYRDAGYPAARMHLVPNFADDPYGSLPSADSSGWLYAGRISAEKGVLELAREWPPDERLDIAGSGPQEADLRSLDAKGVTALGSVEAGELARVRPSYEALIIPSLWFEGAPMVLVEALATGLPVVALDGSGAADTVRSYGVGAVVPRPLTSDGLRAAFAAIRSGGPGLRRHCREVFLEHFTEDVWLRSTEAVYERVLG